MCSTGADGDDGDVVVKMVTDADDDGDNDVDHDQRHHDCVEDGDDDCDDDDDDGDDDGNHEHGDAVSIVITFELFVSQFVS